MAEPAADAPALLGDLTRGEHMLLWAFRAEVCSAGDGGIVRRQFEQACGVVGGEALNALIVFVRELARRGRRRIGLRPPGAYRLSRDEQLVLAVFAAAQAQDYARMEAHLTWLVGADPAPPFAAIACLVGDAFALNGLVLRVPEAGFGSMAAPVPAPAIVARLPARQA
jgi:hypothetical protein